MVSFGSLLMCCWCVALWNGPWKNCTATCSRNLVPMADLLPVERKGLCRSSDRKRSWDVLGRGDSWLSKLVVWIGSQRLMFQWVTILLIPQTLCSHMGVLTAIVKGWSRVHTWGAFVRFLSYVNFVAVGHQKLCHVACAVHGVAKTLVAGHHARCGRRDVWLSSDSVFKTSRPLFWFSIVVLGLCRGHFVSHVPSASTSFWSYS